MTGRFRPAREPDTDAVVRLMRGYYAEDDHAFAERDARAALLDLLHNDQLGRLWVAEAETLIVGYLAVTLGFSLEYRGRDAFVDELFITEEYRGAGLGREAVGIAEAYCREIGVRTL